MLGYFLGTGLVTLQRGLTLYISEPSSYIIGGPDLFVDVGSMVNISCVVLNTEKPPDTVKWLHGDEEISFRGPRNGVSVE